MAGLSTNFGTGEFKSCVMVMQIASEKKPRILAQEQEQHIRDQITETTF